MKSTCNKFTAMKRDRLESYQWAKFIEHWGSASIVIIIGLATEVFLFLSSLNGKPWIYFCLASFAVMTLGAALIAFAKFPIYRAGQFFAFGIKSVPERLAGHYKWGWRLFLFGMVLSLCLLVAK